MWDARRIAAAAAVAAALDTIWLVAREADAPPEPPNTSPAPPAPQSPVGPPARAEAAAPPEVPGSYEADVAPGLDFRQPDQVARAYLVAAHSLTGADRGTTNRRVLPYLAPDNPANPRGLAVVDAPPAGQVSTARVDDLHLVEADQAGRAVAYQARWSVVTGPPPTPAEERTSYVVLVRQQDGRWLVTQETARLQPGG